MNESDARENLIDLWLRKAEDALASAEIELKEGHTNFALCLMLIEQPDMSAIRVKTRYDLSNPQPLQASLNATHHLDSANEASVPASKNYNCTL